MQFGRTAADSHSNLFDRNAPSCYDSDILGGGNAMQRNVDCQNLPAGSRGWGSFVCGLSTYDYFYYCTAYAMLLPPER